MRSHEDLAVILLTTGVRHDPAKLELMTRLDFKPVPDSEIIDSECARWFKSNNLISPTKYNGKDCWRLTYTGCVVAERLKK